jgi:drug/metabolite transporter (DMT)-like permease
MFWLVALIWGSSFMLIRIGVEAVHPVHLVLIRVGIAAVGLSLVVVLTRQVIPHDWRLILAMVAVGIGNNAIPFTLISWGEQSVESGLTSVLQSTAALFALVVAHFAFKDERITPRKLIGLGLGFAGIVVLASRNWQDGQIVTGSFLGQIAIVVASLSYAIFTAVSRKILSTGTVAPIVLAAITMLSATFAEALLVLLGGITGNMPLQTPTHLSLDALTAVLVLGVLNTFIAYLMFYEVVKGLGAARAAMVTYVVPAVGLILEVVFLGEVLDIRIVLGAGLIFAGIGIVNLKFLRWQSAEKVRVASVGD